MFSRSLKLLLLLSFILFFSILFLLNFVNATNCWQYTSSGNCNNDASCRWKSDSWGSSCQELNCWNLNTQSECTTTIVPGKNCTWQTGGTSWGCDKLSCWTLSGTNANNCENNTANLNCQWSNSCYPAGGYSPNVNCYQLYNQSSCVNATGCAWGQCSERGCWSYNTNISCNAAKDWNGRNCTWQGSGSSSWCEQNGCWKYSANQTYCTGNPANLNCQWKWNSCQDVDCYTWDFTNATACVNNTANLSCTWGGSFCMKQDCWSYSSNATCSSKPGCLWKSFFQSGTCQEVNCYTWDSFNAGNQSLCESNSYGLSCMWSGNPPGDETVGWCYKNMASTSCANKTTEKDCMDTFYCWWQYNNWNNVSAGGTCNSPGSFGGTATNTTILNDWNPGCYIFDMNSSDCSNVIGCTYSNARCISSNDVYGGNITANGLNCSYINSSTLCNSIPILASCCSWQNGSCASNKMSATCRDQIQAPPAGASFCEDYSSYENQALCEQIAGSPWYMPCSWNNATGKCGFKASDVFGNETQSLAKIDNKRNCEAAGGKWITESYCEGNVSIPSGRCEHKFNEENNCDKACFACENKDSNGNSVNSTNAESACLGSKLGICEFSANANAQNGIGFCKAKEQFKKGVAGDCDTTCGDCTYKGNPLSNDTTKRPSYYCTVSKANSAGGGCKWMTDNSTATGGYCVNKGEKTCEDSCDRCKTQSDCSNTGRTSVSNQTGSCKWQGSATTGSCVANIGKDVEICWDGVDNNNDNLVDCSDTSCYADSFCGLVSGDCFGWTDNTTCITKTCEWVTDNWGSFCDFKGSQCWKLTQNSSVCNANSNCQWSNGTGNAFCEKDWGVTQVCMGLGQANCMALNASGCNWTVDSWCSGTGNGTTWCNNNGGWCDHVDFKPKDCWKYSSSSGCNGASGCNWRTDSYSIPHCEVNWSANCWQSTSNATCSGNSNCIWDVPPMGGGWCMNKADKCWSYNQTNCNSALDGRCYWSSWSSGGTGSGSSGGSCQSMCWNSSFNTQAGCGSSYGCAWKAESGWCEESSMAACSNITNSNNQSNCMETSGCRWKTSGWCDPKGGGFSTASVAGGGGVGSGMGGDCFKYDGNQTLCTNKTIVNVSCGWNVNPSPSCEVNWGTECWRYASVANGCNVTNGCWFKNDSIGSFCTNVMDECWQNQSLQGSANNDKCIANAYCINNSWGGCEPRCSSLSSTACTNATYLGKCRYTTGWCNPKGMNEMFDNMQAGAAAPLGQDSCGEAGMQASVDICGFGMRDMGDSFGFGMGVSNFENASVCNKEKLSSFVMGHVEGGGGVGIGIIGGGFGQERTGTGNETVVVIVYLDTDGSVSGGCFLSHNSSAAGYEFRLKYTSQWNANTSKAVETFNSEKCEGSDWKATDIKINAWKKKMCSDIGGPMIAIKKADLARFPTLYDSTRDMRIYVATIGNTGNISSPTDTAGPGWTTPGAIDFDIANAFAYGSDTAKFEDILKKGFVQYEDCFNGMDDDGDDGIDCNDWNCQYASKCDGVGVNAASYADTSAPLVLGVIIEEYPDAALIMYDTNKPTNGTLELYGYGDTQCLNKTNDVYDVGILKSSSVRQHKLWHTAMIYETNETIDGKNVSINWPLVGGSTYHYKLKVCDSSGKCAISKCSSFKTPANVQRCSYCNFVTRIKAPDSWNVSYDVERDGTYGHLQGQVCGPNAGLKTNYTLGRKVNIRLAKSDGSVYMEFLNATLTKTGLNDKVRTISNTTSLIHNTTDGYVGMPSETRDKIINNLHPEVCRIKIPFSGTCNALYHCDDNGQNCTDRTGNATLIDSTNCIWNVPYCEFSTYRESTLTTTTTTTTSSGGGGGGGGATGASYVLTEKDFSQGYTQNLAKNDQFKINISNSYHFVKLVGLTATTATINVSSTTQQATLIVGEEKKFDVTDDSKYDLSVKLNSINSTSNKASLSIKAVTGEETTIPATGKEEETEAEREEQAEEAAESKSNILYWIIGIVILAIIAVAVYLKYRKE